MHRNPAQSSHRVVTSLIAFVVLLILHGVAVAPTRAHAPADGSAIQRATASTLKPGLRGLIVTDPSAIRTVPYAKFASVKIAWDTLETSEGSFDFSSFDRTLAAHPGVKFRLRVRAGIYAPQSVKDLSGGCVFVQPDSPNGNSGCVPRFWTDAFHDRFQRLMEAVAARYENNPQVVEVTNSECTTMYTEPFILGADADSIDRLWRAGYTQAGNERCLRRSTAMLMGLFPTTRISVAGHSKWQFIIQGKGGPDDGQFASSWESERTLLNDLIDAYGKRIVLDDHGLGPDDTTCPKPGEPARTAATWYCYMSGLSGSPITFGWQFTLNGGSTSLAADAGVHMGACFLEYAAFQALDEGERHDVHERLLGNCPAADPAPDPTPNPTKMVNQTPPRIFAVVRGGAVVTARRGTWSPTPTHVTYQWIVDGQPIAGARAATYRVPVRHIGRSLSVQVTAHHDTLQNASVTSNALPVRKIATRTQIRATLARSRRFPVATVSVVAEVGTAQGRVTLVKAGHHVASGRLQDGQVSLTRYRLRAGHHRVVAYYTGNADMARSRSAVILRIRHR